MRDPSAVTTFLFTDIEDSTRHWEEAPERMQPALARHDALTRTAVEGNHGSVVKMTGDGVYAAFRDPVDAVNAALQLQQALAPPEATAGIALRVRCGLHMGVAEHRDNDYFGNAVNRAARIMGAAHGGQVLLSQAVALVAGERLPIGSGLSDLGWIPLGDLAGSERVYQLTHPQLRQDFPALRSLEATPNNLPLQVTSFIGRERELIEVKRWLAKTRLLTLLGVGGIGKTRLSLQAAAAMFDDFPDGVWLVELAPLSDERLVAQAVASALKVKEEAGRSVQDSLAKHVQNRRLLLVLDNCEHLGPACAELAGQLLQAGPQVKLLTTSREPLHAAGEATYPVPSLTVPDPRQVMTVEDLTHYEAVRLFIGRAVSAQPSFQLTPRNAAAIADICHRLDGIPLALELAAARVRALSAGQIAAHLSDRFRLLTGGDRTALPRQQALRACIDWSYNLLTEPERVLLRRLAVFAGGWTPEAADAVGTGGEIAATEVLDLLARLVDKSLVVVESGGERYRLLETVREYAQERLHDSDEGSATRTRHLQFFLALAERAAPELWGAEQGTWVARLELERKNLLAAHAWCDHPGDTAAQGLRLVNHLQLFWLPSGLLELGYRLTLEALARAGAQEHNKGRCDALYAASQLAYFMLRFQDAQAYAEQSLEIARETGNQVRVADVLLMLGYAADELKQPADALAHFENSIALARALGDRARLSFALNALAGHHSGDDPNTAVPLFEESLALAREVGDRESVAITLHNIVRAFIGLGRSERTSGMLLEVLEIALDIGSKKIEVYVLDVCAALAAMRGEWICAARFLGAADGELTRLGLHRMPGDEEFLAPLMSRAREQLGTTAFAAEQAAARGRSREAALAEARVFLT